VHTPVREASHFVLMRLTSLGRFQFSQGDSVNETQQLVAYT